MIDDSEGVEGLVDKNLYMNGGSWWQWGGGGFGWWELYTWVKMIDNSEGVEELEGGVEGLHTTLQPLKHDGRGNNVHCSSKQYNSVIIVL